jgi:hypothetical protein
VDCWPDACQPHDGTRAAIRSKNVIDQLITAIHRSAWQFVTVAYDLPLMLCLRPSERVVEGYGVSEWKKALPHRASALDGYRDVTAISSHRKNSSGYKRSPLWYNIRGIVP